MSSFVMDPDLRQALEDVVKASPSNGVFSGLGATGVRGAFALPDQPISIARAGISSAERHILQVHRGELAWLLEEAFRISHLQVIGPDPDIEPQENLGTMEDLVPQAERVQERTPPLAMRYRSGYFLGKVLMGQPIKSADERGSLLVAAMRLRDSSFARHGYAHVELKRGRTRAARQAAECLLDGGDPMMAAYAHSLYREAFRCEGDIPHAVRHGMAALDLGMSTGRVPLARTEAALLVGCSVNLGAPLDRIAIEGTGLSLGSALERAQERLDWMRAMGRVTNVEYDRDMAKLRGVIS